MSQLDGNAISQIQNMAVASLNLEAKKKYLFPAIFFSKEF